MPKMESYIDLLLLFFLIFESSSLPFMRAASVHSLKLITLLLGMETNS